MSEEEEATKRQKKRAGLVKIGEIFAIKKETNMSVVANCIACCFWPQDNQCAWSNMHSEEMFDKCGKWSCRMPCSW